MDFFRKIYYFFSRYANPAERRVGKFFRKVNEKDAPHKVEKALNQLLQRDIAVINLWTEHRYKGYSYLTKRMRRELYANLAAIKQDFAAFEQAQTIDVKPLLASIAHKGVNTARLAAKPERLAYIAAIMHYLAPRNKRYVYRESSSFGRLLRDPTKEILEGDCNQIVTLYIALYAAKFNVTDLKLTLYPGHVALHFDGVDIETTNGTFAKYAKEGQATVPIHEIVSVNLLDTHDIHYQKSIVDPQVLLESARLAYATSSHRKLVKKNLEAMYNNVVRQFLQTNDYQRALNYAKQSKSHELIEISAHNGAVHAMRQKQFKTARKFASASQQQKTLAQTIDRNEAAHLYNAKQYDAARKIYSRLNDTKMVQQCYRGLYVQAQNRLGTIKTADDVKANANTVRTMERYAKRSGDAQLMQSARNLAKHL